MNLNIIQIIFDSLFDAFVSYGIPLLIIMFVILIILRISRHQIKSGFNYSIIATYLDFVLNNEEYTVYRDVYVPVGNYAIRIDILVVSKYGVFIIDVEHYRGIIFGQEFDKKWTQVFYNHKSEFNNPLAQNYKHSVAVADYLDITEDKVYPIIYFSGDVKFRNKMPHNIVVKKLAKHIVSMRSIKFNGRELNQIQEKISTLISDNVVVKNKWKHYEALEREEQKGETQ